LDDDRHRVPAPREEPPPVIVARRLEEVRDDEDERSLTEPWFPGELLEGGRRPRVALPLFGLGPPRRRPPVGAGQAGNGRPCLERAVDDQPHDLANGLALVE